MKLKSGGSNRGIVREWLGLFMLFGFCLGASSQGAHAQMSPDVIDPGIVVVGDPSRCSSQVVIQSLVKSVLSRFKGVEKGKVLNLSDSDRSALLAAVQSVERSCQLVPQNQCNGGLLSLHPIGGVLVRTAPAKACR